MLILNLDIHYRKWLYEVVHGESYFIRQPILHGKNIFNIYNIASKVYIYIDNYIWMLILLELFQIHCKI
jgi:hypothetical protein